MRGTTRRLGLVFVLALPAAEAAVACAAHERKDAAPTPSLPTPPPPQTAADAKGLTEYASAVKAYVALHHQAEAGLPRLPDQADPAKVTAHQRALAEAIRRSGPRPRPGHVFGPNIQPFFKRALAPELKGPGSAETREKVAEGNPETAKGLPRDLEYRFVGKSLILRDTVANVIVDFIPGAIP